MRVVVAGAGLAGLAAARDLARRGAEPIVVDARDRVGGRVHTIRRGFEGDQHGEAGADLIESDHAFVLDLARELRLEPVRILRHGWGFYGADARGRLRIRRGAGVYEAIGERLSDEIAAYRLAGGRWDSPVAARLARMSVAGWLERIRADAGFAAVVRGLRGFFLADAEHLSLLALVDQFAFESAPAEPRQYRIAGGNDRLATAAARTLPRPVALNTVVRRIAQHERGVRVTVEGARREEIDADYAVLTLPPSALRDVIVEPALPSGQARAVASLAMGPATRVLVQCATRFWRRPGRPSAFGTDRPFGAVWDGNEEQARRPGILTLLAGGSASREVRAILAEGGAAALLERLRWLGAPSAPLALRTIAWEDDPWAGGGYAVFDPAFPVELRDSLARAEGRLVFAGEHTSTQWQGYMNGAIESGKRAALEVLALRDLSA